jgi:hypothetical protein
MRRTYLSMFVAAPLVILATISFAQADNGKPEEGAPRDKDVQVAEGGSSGLEADRSSATSNENGGGNPDRNGSPPKNPALIEVEETIHHCVVDNCW